MRDGVLSTVLACLMCFGALAIGGCGGDETNRREVTWRPNARLPGHAEHWWWEPTERTCEEDDDCRSGERCQRMQLSSCEQCPRGEDAMVCVERRHR